MDLIKRTIHAPHSIHNKIPKDKDKDYHVYKSDAVNTLTNYINLIYKYLNAIEMCFTTGSFVIEDNLDKLLDVLIVSSSTGLEGLFASHTSLNPVEFKKEINGITYVSKGLSETHIHSRIEGQEGVPISCSHLRDTKNNLIIDHRHAQNIKWYKFLNGNNKDFVFFNLERFKTCDTEHIKNAFNRYCREHDTESEYTSRREDCKQKCVYLYSDRKKNIDEIVIEDPSYKVDETIIKIDGSYKVNENYNRVGDEFFIPQVLSNYFLHLIEDTRFNIDNIEIKKHHDNTKGDVVTINKKAYGGRRKKKVLKKKKLQKK
jgi:hypothetical protein